MATREPTIQIAPGTRPNHANPLSLRDTTDPADRRVPGIADAKPRPSFTDPTPLPYFFPRGGSSRSAALSVASGLEGFADLGPNIPGAILAHIWAQSNDGTTAFSNGWMLVANPTPPTNFLEAAAAPRVWPHHYNTTTFDEGSPSPHTGGHLEAHPMSVLPNTQGRIWLCLQAAGASSGILRVILDIWLP